MKPLFLAIMLGAGCYYGPSGTPVDCEHGQPEQCLAQTIVWTEIMGETRPAPLIQWDSGLPFDPKAEAPMEGEYFTSCDCIEMATRTPIWKSAYVHELMHSHLTLLGRDDCDHCDPEWGALTDFGYYHIYELSQRLSRELLTRRPVAL